MSTLLSICIPTLNRPKLLKSTLESIFKCNKSSIEVVIIDGSKNNNTKDLIYSEYKNKNISYYKESNATKKPSNQGFDRACNLAVEKAKSKYCWLLTDDDLIVDGSIDIILEKIKKNYDLILTSSVIKDETLTKTYVISRPKISKDIIFKPSQMDKFAKIINDQLTYVGCLIIKKSIWMSLNRSKFFGTGFIHVGVIFSSKLKNKLLLIQKPMTIIRFGVGYWRNRTFQIWMYDWPNLIWSLKTIKDSTKSILSKKDPWKNPKTLLLMRALGNYDHNIFKQYLQNIPLENNYIIFKIIALIPRSVLFVPALLYIYLIMPNNRFLINSLFSSYRRTND